MESEWIHPDFPMKVAPYPEDALPVLTYSDEMILRFNGEEIRLFHPGPGHTDGDTVVFFTKANVIHMGDLYFNGGYPFIDVPHGGSIDAVLDCISRILEQADGETKIIPGHGPLSNKAELEKYRDMLVQIRSRIDKMIQEGKSLEDVMAAKPTADFDRTPVVMMPPDFFVKIVYQSLSRKK
jgi:glyoxylase-like metal-dependent hydrolase (beta-lactamase superfamily II)